MSRPLSVVVVIAGIGVAIATHSSSAASPPRAAQAVTVTPRLKRLLQLEIATLRAAQPRAPRTVAPPRAVPPRAVPPPRLVAPAPERGVPCYVASSSRCPEIPCREFASGGAVLETSSTMIVVPGARRRTVATPACTRRAPRRLVLVSEP